MKHTKRARKILSFLLALTLVLGMGMTVFAAPGDEEETPEETQPAVTTPAGTGDFTITLTGVANDKHSYGAYQIFSGDLLEQNGTATLSNIEWGSGVNQNAIDDLIAELQTIEAFKDLSEDASAAQVAAVLNGVGNDAETAKAFAEALGKRGEDGELLYLDAPSKTSEAAVKQGDGTYNYQISGLTAGYYLVQDMNGDPGEDDANTRNILEVVGDVSAKVKSETPTVEKKIVDGDKKADANTAGVGKVVSYEITGKVPEWSGYDKYFYVISDTLSEGLTFNEDISVTVGGQDIPVIWNPTAVKDEAGNVIGAQDEEGNQVEGAAAYVYTDTEAAPYTFRLTFSDIKAFTPGQDIVVNYSATVNADAVTGVEGNPNKVILDYSNNPNHNYDKDEGKPGIPDSEKNPPIGTTPEDITITYVTEIDIDKVDGDGNPLAGATFTLTGTSYQTVLTERTYYVEDPDGTYYLLKDGTYTETAPTGVSMEESNSSTAGYVMLDKDTITEEDGVVQVDGEYYRPYIPGTDDGEQLYVMVLSAEDAYVNPAVRYSEAKETVTKKVPTKVNMTVTSGADGKVIFKGLGEGDYTIKETGVPAGYNKADDIRLVITCKLPEGDITDASQEAVWMLGEGTTEGIFSVNDDGAAISGLYAATVANYSGSVLPSTGGIGTKIFYVTGGFLVLAAVILLVAKKRMSGAEN